MTRLMISNWLVFWRETGDRESITRELSADVPGLGALRSQYHVDGMIWGADRIDPVMRAVADVSRASGVPVSELVRMADARHAICKKL